MCIRDRLETAQALASTGVSSKEQRQAIAEAIKGVKFTTAFGKILQRLLRTGVGIHHAGMLPRYRRLVEQLAQQGLLPVICGTDTLGVGINVPIHSGVSFRSESLSAMASTLPSVALISRNWVCGSVSSGTCHAQPRSGSP